MDTTDIQIINHMKEIIELKSKDDCYTQSLQNQII